MILAMSREGFGAMAENFDADPQDMRARGNAHHNVAPFYREKGKPDQEFLDSYYAHYGLASHAFGVRITEYSQERQATWEGIADFHEQLGRANNGGADDFDHTDAAGAAATRAPETDV